MRFQSKVRFTGRAGGGEKGTESIRSERSEAESQPDGGCFQERASESVGVLERIVATFLFAIWACTPCRATTNNSPPDAFCPAAVRSITIFPADRRALSA